MTTSHRRKKGLPFLLGMTLLLWLSAVSGQAGVNEGLLALDSGDYATAFREWLPLAQQGNATAQHNLGVMYLKGQGVRQDYAQAVQWFRRAADQGFALAQYSLGVSYLLGSGVPQDRVQGYLWVNLAAARMPPGTDRDVVVAARDVTAAYMTPTQLAVAQALARVWQPKPETPTADPSLFPSPKIATSPQTSPRRDLILQVQERLQAAGFSPGTIDGAMGPQTREALRWFQNTQRLVPTGETDEKTLDALGVR